MWIAVITITGIALIAGLLLSFASRRLPPDDDDLVSRVNDLLPQTQCGQCGYPGCRPYAAAIVHEGTAINLCPPGGQLTVQRLADLLGREAVPLEVPAGGNASVAVIDESLCIGCTHCRAVCPVDAIVGAHQFMHTILSKECTGCELCLPPCPVDCIRMRPAA
ncbi:MAG: electron transport complex subunit RsxB [Woeseiaceae bacterium]